MVGRDKLVGAHGVKRIRGAELWRFQADNHCMPQGWGKEGVLVHEELRLDGGRAGVASFTRVRCLSWRRKGLFR